jgi:hypothetical protein
MENGQYMFPYDMNPLLPKGKLQYTPPAIAASFAAYYASMAQSRRASKKANQAAMAIKAASTSGQFKAPGKQKCQQLAVISNFLLQPPPSGRYPSYFLQQNDILSDRQSKVMDYELDSQVWGMADAMRRRALVAVNDVAVEKDPESSSLLDVGAGTGSEWQPLSLWPRVTFPVDTALTKRFASSQDFSPLLSRSILCCALQLSI